MNVGTPIIGSDFMAHYYLLLDCRSKCFIDDVTGFVVCGKFSTINQCSIKSVIKTSLYTVFIEFLEITCPTVLSKITYVFYSGNTRPSNFLLTSSFGSEKTEYSCYK